MNALFEKIRLAWDECKNNPELQERLKSSTFFRQEQQDLMKSWMDCSIPEEKLNKIAQVKAPAAYEDAKFDEVCDEVGLTDDEKKQLSKVVDNFSKRKNQVISLDNYAKKIPLAFSLSKFKTNGPLGDASKRTFSYFLNPLQQFPAKEEKLKEVCNQLGCESTDESLLELMNSLKLEGCICENAANQTSVYWEILWVTFYVKTVWIVGASWTVDGKNKSFIEKMYEENYWEGGADPNGRIYNSQMKSLRSIKKGDIIAIKTHKNNRRDLDIRCVGIVTCDARETDEGSNWFSCSVSWVENFEPVVYEEKYPSYNGTIRRCAEKTIINNLSKIIDGATFKINKEKADMQKYLDLLMNNHNIILHGAPGTGKTYLAEKIAREMECNDKRIGFVQFHQSYDYTDFVEGLRPLKKDNSSDIYFEKIDGVFKSFCEVALKNLRNANDDNSSKNKTLQVLLDDFLTQKEDAEVEFTLKKGDHFKISHCNDRYIYIDNGEKKQDVKIAKKDMVCLLEANNIENVVDIKKLFNRTHRQKDSYMFSLYNEIKKMTNKHVDSDKTLAENTPEEKVPVKNFVFIIDEINRGEMSKIFGELFYAVDPGYRVSWDDIKLAQKKQFTKPIVRTQYANMENDPNEWDDALQITEENNFGHFFVPQNVYIIGTMNDIDRSIESMDFAMRRRFAFEEITAEQSMKMFDDPKAWKDKGDKEVQIPKDILEHLKNRMRNLNTAILEPRFNLGQAYQIGGAYFLKFAKYYENDEINAFTKLWNYHLKGLLTEYLRGMPKAKELLDKLEEAFKDDVSHESQKT